jgi:hypothetical protein
MTSKNIFATYSEEYVTVYQAFGNNIADELLLYGKFGPSFSLNRTSWIKTSFLWMMHRSEWATKINQERIFSIQITKEGFDNILSQAVLTKFKPKIHGTSSEWKKKFNTTNVLCQLDPDRDIYGRENQRKAVQLGLKNEILDMYVNDFIVDFVEITDDVRKYKKMISENNYNFCLPEEKEYVINGNIAMEIGLIKKEEN